MKEKVHIVLASDANYLPGLEVTRATMLTSCSDSARIVFHIFDDPSALQLQLPTATFPLWNGSLMPYLRLFLPQLLPDVDQVIYSDVDTIWNRDVCELWEATASLSTNHQPLTTSPSICWVRDMASMRYDAHEWISKVAAGEGIAFDWSRYACSGICVMNLKKMRETNFTQRVLDLYAKYGVPKFPDQDALNVLFNHDSVLLPLVWGAMGDPSNLPPVDEKCVYHLTGAGRHFHDKTPPTYPPQYQLWWRMRNRVIGDGNVVAIPFRTRILSATWSLHGLATVLPLRLRERIVRQWFFAKVLVGNYDYD